MDRLIADLDEQFSRLDRELRELVATVTPDLLYRRSRSESGRSSLSGGEQILRSAAVVEQTFGGLTANLWDDPFEWTLPETLPTPAAVAAYLGEVETTRQRGFMLLKSDDDLAKEIMAPAGVIQLRPLLLDTLARARHYLHSAQTTFELVRSKI